MLLDSISVSYKVLLMRSKKVYLNRLKLITYRFSRSSNNRKYNVQGIKSSVFFNAPFNSLCISGKITLFFESYILYSKGVISNEYSSSYFNSYNIFYPLLAFCIFVKRPFVRFFRRRKSAYYWDTFRFILFSHTNIFFPWIEASLQSSYCASQVNFFNNRRGQFRWINIMISLSKKFIKVSKHRSFHMYKKYSCVGLKYLIRGRVLNNTFCRIQRRVNVGSTCLTTKSISSSFVFNSVDYCNFISYWGSSNIYVFWNYKNIF